jgi:hypothetical protein
MGTGFKAVPIYYYFLLMPVNQSRFNQNFIFTQTVERKFIVFVLSDTVEYIRLILDFDGFENRLTQIIADGMTITTH